MPRRSRSISAGRRRSSLMGGRRRRRRSVSSCSTPDSYKGGRRRSMSGGRKKRSSSKGHKTKSKKYPPVNVNGEFKAYDVAKKKMVHIKNPKLIKIHSSRGWRAMIQGTSPASGNKVTTFVSTKDKRVSKHFH